jgi:hypothetical protein
MMKAEHSKMETTSSEVQRDGQVPSSTEIYIDPVMERRIVTKFDWLVLPQFVIIIILG